MRLRSPGHGNAAFVDADRLTSPLLLTFLQHLSQSSIPSRMISEYRFMLRGVFAYSLFNIPFPVFAYGRLSHQRAPWLHDIAGQDGPARSSKDLFKSLRFSLTFLSIKISHLLFFPISWHNTRTMLRPTCAFRYGFRPHRLIRPTKPIRSRPINCPGPKTCEIPSIWLSRQVSRIFQTRNPPNQVQTSPAARQVVGNREPSSNSASLLEQPPGQEILRILIA